jgi:hypothetical protein
MVWSNVKMYLHGAILAAGTAFTMSVEQVLSSGVMLTTGQLKTDGITALSVGILYLLKTIFMGSSSQNSTIPPATGDATKLLLIFVMVSILSSCTAFKTIKWSDDCGTGGCNICAGIDSVKFVNQTEQQLLNTVKLPSSVINNLAASIGNINWTFNYTNGKVCIGATLGVQKSFGSAPQLIPVTETDKQKAVIGDIWKALHK